jgi:predicted nucleic acid-binding protein
MRVLLDTDVVLDFLLERTPFAEAAAELFEMIALGTCDGHVAAITPVNIFYIARKTHGGEEARRGVAALLRVVRVCPVDNLILSLALASPIGDYEDAVQHACAVASGLDAIVTRNLGDYENATLPVFSPAAFLTRLKSQQP